LGNAKVSRWVSFRVSGSRRGAVACIVTACPSCGYVPLQRLTTNRCTALLVRRSRPAPNATQMSHARSGIPADPSATPPKRSSSSPVVTPTSGLYPTWPADLPAARSEEQNSSSTSDSHGVFSPSTLQPERVHSTPACRTGYVPSSGFYTLSTACSSLERPALFHAGNAHGVLALQGFSLAVRSRRLVTGGFPSWRFSSHCGVNSAMLGTRFSANTITAPASRAFAASRGLLRQRIRTAAGLLHPLQTADSLLSFLRLSRVFPHLQATPR
jgi:hypothetical protein